MAKVSIVGVSASILWLVSATAWAAEPEPTGAPAAPAASVAAAAPAAAAATDAPVSGASEPSNPHPPGFYASFLLGPGYGSFGADTALGDMSFGGVGFAASLLFGGMLRGNLALVADLRLLSVPSPTLEVGDVSSDIDGLTLTHLGLGPGVVYYVMPANVSLGASALLTRMVLSTDDDDDEVVARTNWGVGGGLRVGKEWALKRGGIGVLGEFSLSSMPDKNDGPRWTGTALSLSAAYTYN